MTSQDAASGDDGFEAAELLEETIEVRVGPDGASFRADGATYFEIIGLIVFAIILYVWVSRPGRRRRSRLP